MDWLQDNNIYKYHYNSDRIILYSPIARKYVLATEKHLSDFLEFGLYSDTINKLADYVPLNSQKKVCNPSDYVLLTVLPNNICNFNCSYCYSAQSRNGAELSFEKLKVAIDYFFETKTADDKRTLTISFMGGGEPMLSWECIRHAITYSREKSEILDKKLRLRIITNGSIIDNEIINFIISKKVDLSVSFEVIEKIQNIQRKNYKLVYGNIKKLIESGIDVQINSTITPANVALMTEMIEVIHLHFPQISNVMFEPVVGEGLFNTPGEMADFYDKYIDGFVSSRKIADNYGISITSFAYLRTVFPLERACPGEFCVTADGDITGCYCISTKNDPLFNKTQYGTIDKGKIKFNMENYRNLMDVNVYKKDKCSSCEVKWNCGGGCFHQFSNYSESYQNVVCDFTRKFVKQLVKYKIDKYLNTNNQDIVLPILFNEKL